MFICFEGIDGAGKTTQARMLFQALTAAGVKAELVADPGTTKIGTSIRQILLDNDGPITPIAQMLLFSAARAELADYITKRLADKYVIICDRWLLSTLVYQGVINGISQDLITSVFEQTSGIYPDICFLLDLPPTAAKKRMGRPRDRYERKGLADRKKMRSAYVAFAREKDFARVTHFVDAQQLPEVTHHQILRIVLAGLKDCPVSKRTESKNARNGRPRVRRPKSRT